MPTPLHAPSEQTGFYLDKALKLLDLGPARETRIKQAPREIACELLPAGAPVPVRAWRLQGDRSRGPLLGGLRCHAGLAADELRALARLATWQQALYELPYGGAAGGIAIDPDQLEPGLRESLLRAYAASFGDLLGPDRDCLCPDFGSDPQAMAWLHDAGACVAGKPAALGGLPLAEDAAAISVVAAISAHLRHEQRELSGQRCVVLGFGRLGAGIAQLLHAAGAWVIAVSDTLGGIHDPQGLDIPVVLRSAEAFGSCTRHDGVAALEPEALCALDCDILIPATLGGALNERNAESIRAGLVAEAASLATTPEAHAVLLGRGTTVLPDLLCNAGAALLAARELAGPQGREREDAAWLRHELEARVTTVYEQVRSAASRRQTDLHTAAYVLGIERLAEAIAWRGGAG